MVELSLNEKEKISPCVGQRHSHGDILIVPAGCCRELQGDHGCGGIWKGFLFRLCVAIKVTNRDKDHPVRPTPLMGLKSEPCFVFL